MTAPDVNADVRARFEEPLDVRRKVLVDSLRASKGWMTGYAEAFVDTYVDDARADMAGEVRELVEALKLARDYAAYVQGEPDDLAVMDAALAKHTHQEKP